MGGRIRLYAQREPDARETWLIEQAGMLAVQEVVPDGAAGVALPLPPGVLATVFTRYARPLEHAIPPAPDEPRLAGVRTFNFMRWGDVEPQAYLLYEVEGAEPIAAPAPLIAAALTALARAAQK